MAPTQVVERENVAPNEDNSIVICDEIKPLGVCDRFYTMYDGQKMPMIGMGCWMVCPISTYLTFCKSQEKESPEQVHRALRHAIDIGYRYIDTAALYGNESVVGDVLKEVLAEGKLKREDFFVSTKLSFIMHRPENARKAITESLKRLRLDYVDLYLMHTPLPFVPNSDRSAAEETPEGLFIPEDIPLIDTWRVLESEFHAGRLRAIGLSNVNVQQLSELCGLAEVKPHNIQTEIHVYLAENDLIRQCRNMGITVTGYSTLGSPGRALNPVGRVFVQGSCLDDPVVVRLSKKYNCTPGQILLRHSIQRGISVVPKSSNEQRLRQNLDIFGFCLNHADMAELNQLDEGKRFFPFDFALHHPNYPFSV